MTNAEQVQERAHTEQGQMVMPFYIICDVSFSMSGDMAALNDALAKLRQTIVSEPVVDDVARIGVLTFADSAEVVVPLAQLSETPMPTLAPKGGTNYGAAFLALAKAIVGDRDDLKRQGYKIYRPCAFFLTDGEPLDGDYEQTFRTTLTKAGMDAYPIFVPFGFRDAPEAVLRKLAYPPEKGKWFMARTSDVSQALDAILDIIMKTVITSGQRAASGTDQATQIAEPDPGTDITSGDSEFIS